MFLSSKTATNYRTLLDDVETFLTNRALESVVIAAGGTGYTVGDVLTVAGGTLTGLGYAAQLTVTSVAAGVIDGVRISQSGSYTADPTSPNAATGGTGSSATFTLTMAVVGWTRNMRTQEAVSAAISAGGTGYALTDVLTLVGGVEVLISPQFAVSAVGVSAAAIAGGGTGYTVSDVLTVVGGTGTAATLTVTSVAGGVIDGISVTTPGSYTVVPGNPVSVTGGTGTLATFNLTVDIVTAVTLVTAGKLNEVPANPAATSGAGTGCTLTVTYQDYQAASGNFDLLLQGVGSGADDLFIGMRVIGTGPVRSWELHGMTGYDAAQTFENQPGISPGDALSAEGAYIPLDNSAMTYWVFANGRRIILIAKVGAATYTNLYMGWLNPFGTSTEYPYPMVIAGCNSLRTSVFGSGAIGYSGMLDPISALNHVTGPCYYRDVQGAWNTVRNSREITGSTREAKDDFVIWPAGTPNKTFVAAEDNATSGLNLTTDLIPRVGNPGTATKVMKQTPETPDDISLLWPTLFIRSGDGGSIPRDVHGELDNVYWTSADIDGAAATAVSEDRLVDPNDDEYIFFQNCNRTELFSYFCVKEE